jgi:hypothetical protein
VTVQVRVLRGGEPFETLDLEPGASVLVGRDPEADLRLRDLKASRRHASLELTPDGLRVEDLGSTAGTFVDGERLEGARVVPLPCAVAIGGHVLQVGEGAPASTEGVWVDYERGDLLGEGAFGKVYAATRRADGQAVAVKVLPAPDEGQRERFQREADLCASLEHENLVRLLEVRIERGGLYQVLELVAGGEDLGDRIAAQGQLPIELVLSVARQAAAGLQAIHDAGLVHRDVKPGNLLFTPAGQVKIADFGLARSTESGGTLTKTNMGLGTPAHGPHAGPRRQAGGAERRPLRPGRLPLPRPRWAATVRGQPARRAALGDRRPRADLGGRAAPRLPAGAGQDRAAPPEQGAGGPLRERQDPAQAARQGRGLIDALIAG